MKKILRILIIGILLSGCKNNNTEEKKSGQNVEFNQELADELKKMAEIDQIAAQAYSQQTEYPQMSQEQWKAFKDSVYATNQKRAKEIFDQHGFVGFDLVGKKGSQNFWLIVQHSDHDPDFQKEVLEKMKAEVENGNADSSEYAYLTDRVNLNTGEAQIYGTQLDYNMEVCQAFSRNLADSLNVNKRRAEIGLEPLEDFLNLMTLVHFEMNKDFYAKKGVTEPKLYEVE